MTAVPALKSIPASLRENFSWLDDVRLKKVVTALETVEPGCARFVGGCVRDSLLGVQPKDFDLATTLVPDEASRALKEAGLGVAPTGITHGTITAIVDHQGVEVTTLRKDVSTDGRRATVAFTREWSVDAQRRDFTVNAIYLTPDGQIYNPVAGVKDASNKCVRFIGDPHARIREDYLRILRFFRFSARFGASFDKAGITACADLKDGIESLSAERIGAEFSSILMLANALSALTAMEKTGVLEKIWAVKPDLAVASKIKQLDGAVSAPLMLAALYGDEGESIGARLRFSNAEKSLRSSALKNVSLIEPKMNTVTLRALIYRLGKDLFMDALVLAAARGIIPEEQYQQAKSFADAYEVPEFSLTGKDLVALGIRPGPQVSRILSAIEAAWIAEDFPDTVRQRAILKAEIAKSGV